MPCNQMPQLLIFLPHLCSLILCLWMIRLFHKNKHLLLHNYGAIIKFRKFGMQKEYCYLIHCLHSNFANCPNRKSPFYSDLRKTRFRLPSINAKITGWRCDEEWVVYSLRLEPHRLHSNCREKNVRNHLNLRIKVKITNNTVNQRHVLPVRCWGHHVTSVKSLQRCVACLQLWGSRWQTQTEGILYSSWPGIF